MRPLLLVLLVALLACSGADALRARHLTTPAAAPVVPAPCPAAALAQAQAAAAQKPQEPAVTTTAIDIHAPDAATASPVVNTAAPAAVPATAAATPAAAANTENIPVVSDTDVEPHMDQLQPAAPLSAPAAAAKPRFAQVLMESESEVDLESEAAAEAELEAFLDSEVDVEAMLESEDAMEADSELDLESEDALDSESEVDSEDSAELDSESELEDVHDDVAALAEMEAEAEASAPAAVIRQPWWPSAIKSTQGMKMGPLFSTQHKFKIVLHTTEGGSASGAINTYKTTGANNPHFTVEMSGGKFRAYQHIPITNGGRALRHPANTCDTNDANAIQIEIVGTAKKANTFSKSYLDGIGSLLKWIKQQTGIPAVAPSSGFVAYPASGGAKAKQRMTCPQWLAFSGLAGHQHVPNNDHGDPGAIDYKYLLSKMA